MTGAPPTPRAAGLGARPRLRRAAVVAWSGFLGAIPILLAWIGAWPDGEALDLARLSGWFFAAWGSAALAAALAVLLDAHGR